MMTAGAPELQDPILKQIEDGIEAKVKPELKQLYQSIVTAAMSIMFGKETHALMQKRLASDPDITKAVSSAVADLIAGIYNKIGARLPPDDKQKFLPAAALASVTLMCQMLDYAEKTGGAQVSEDMAGKCAQMTTSAVLQKFGVGPDKVQKAVQMAQAQQAGAPGGAAPPAQGV
jgi:hypothetical protein